MLTRSEERCSLFWLVSLSIIICRDMDCRSHDLARFQPASGLGHQLCRGFARISSAKRSTWPFPHHCPPGLSKFAKTVWVADPRDT